MLSRKVKKYIVVSIVQIEFIYYTVFLIKNLGINQKQITKNQ